MTDLTATLNIGLAVNGEADLTPREVLRALHGYAFTIGARVWVSDTERTLVVRVAEPVPADKLHDLAVSLRQEAIAQRYADGTGILAGPNAAAWGDFTPAYFILINGARAG